MVHYRLIIAPANVPLQRIGYTGDLKAIGRMLGVTRSEDTTGITGFDAVRRTSVDVAEVMRSNC